MHNLLKEPPSGENVLMPRAKKEVAKQVELDALEIIQPALPDTPEEASSGEGKKILILTLAIVAVFALAFGGFRYYDALTGANVVNIDDLHAENLAGDLEADQGYTYNGFSFVFADGLWWSEIRQPDRILKIPLRYGPREVENVTVEGKLALEFNRDENVTMAIDPFYANKYYSLALSELNNNIASGIRRRPVAACTENNEAVCEGREIISCEHNQGRPVIEIQNKVGEAGKVTLKGTCILITGDNLELVRAADRLIWQWYRVMN